ncbi:Uncharacterised protein [Mycobacteroides abscessus]|nr:Uncharacterised protein [Mycobacteroides abscessus]
MASLLPARRIAVTVVPMPTSSGSVTLRSTRSWRAWSIERSSSASASSGPCDSPSSGASAAIAMEDATSPPACPPMPSATTSRCGPA